MLLLASFFSGIWCAILDFASLRICLTLDLRCCLHNVCNILKVASLICEVIKEQINKNTEAAERKQKQNNRNTRAEQPGKHMNNEQQEHWRTGKQHEIHNTKTKRRRTLPENCIFMHCPIKKKWKMRFSRPRIWGSPPLRSVASAPPWNLDGLWRRLGERRSPRSPSDVALETYENTGRMIS